MKRKKCFQKKQYRSLIRVENPKAHEIYINKTELRYFILNRNEKFLSFKYITNYAIKKYFFYSFTNIICANIIFFL
jgi:hypothetical protein